MLKNVLIPTYLVLFLFNCKTSSISQSKKVIKNNYAWVDRIIDSTMQAENIPAISLGIVENGKLLYSKGFGTLNRDKKEFATENTIYQIGSDTKKMTGIIAKKLADEGKLQLRESIVKYLGDTIADSTKLKLEKITMEHLLTHKAGIPYRTLSNPRKDGDAMIEPYTLGDLLNDINAVQLQFEPGSDFGYSNFDYAIAGHICELVSEMSYAELIKKSISDAYSMSNTSLYLNERQKSLLATPYRKDNREISTSPWNTGKLAPAGGVYSNITDLSKLMIEQIKAYQSYNKSGSTSSPLYLTMDDTEKGGHYGFGLGKSVDEDGVRYGHGGDLDGYASAYIFSPEKSTGLILLTSSGGEWVGQIEKKIQKKLFK